MTFWAEVFLGVIALATLTMATIQVAVIVFGWRVARRVDGLITQIERDMKPVAESLNAVARDASRVSALVAGQVERIDRLTGDLTNRLDQIASALQDAVLRPLRDGAAIMSGVKAVLEVIRDLTTRPGDRPGRPDEDDSLFIG